MTRALIGITGRRAPFDGPAVPKTFSGVPTDVLIAAYAERVHEAGGMPVLLPLDPSVGGYAADLVARLDGLVLAGGADVGESRYESAGPKAPDLVPAQDEHELSLLAAADAAGLPVLGICRGLQVLNVHRGGTLVRDLSAAGLPGHDVYGDSPAEISHRLTPRPGTRLAAVLGPEVEVNSLHHQAVDRLGRGLVVSARADDGVVEALEDPDRPVLAVQWHPEWLPGRPVLFEWLVAETARARADDLAAVP